MQSLTISNSEFPFSYPRPVAIPRLKSPVWPTILPIAGGKIVGFIPFPRVLMLCEMQTASSRIWTHFTESISYDDIHNQNAEECICCNVFWTTKRRRNSIFQIILRMLIIFLKIIIQYYLRNNRDYLKKLTYWYY